MLQGLDPADIYSIYSTVSTLYGVDGFSLFTTSLSRYIPRGEKLKFLSMLSSFKISEDLTEAWISPS
jgi:hypothetical protein